MVVYAKITALEVAITKLQVTATHYEMRIVSLEQQAVEHRRAS